MPHKSAAFLRFHKENELNNRKKSNNRKQGPVFQKSRYREMQVSVK